MHVCHLIDSLSAGGAENMVLNIAKKADNEMKTSVIYLNPPNTLKCEFDDVGINTYQISTNQKERYRGLADIYYQLNAKNFDILHTHLPASTILGRIIGRLTRTNAVISTQHNITNAYSRRSMFVERITRPLDACTVAVSNSVKDSLGRSFNDNIKVIHNGVNVNDFPADRNSYFKTEYPNINSKYKFVNVGRYVTQKSQSHLIPIMKHLLNQNIDAHLFIVGWGPLKAHLENLISRQNLENHITVTGYVDDVTDYYRNADLFISTSKYEGLPVTILEAMASRLPVVGTNVAGISEVVRPNTTGYMAEYGDIRSLADKTAKLIRENNIDSFGGQAERHVQNNFSIELTVKQYNALYQNVK